VLLLNTAKKKRCKLDVAHAFFQKSSRDAFVCLSCRNYNSVPASQACLTQFLVIERFYAESKNKGSGCGALAVSFYNFLLTVLLEQRFPTFVSHVPLKHSDT